ncbi:virulence-associated E family protein [Caballeronia sp. AZ10_KS36]|uniref:virulence-associated E family protein n=1 Tax=Caballeronia sp. AZ10_KS36 TaxID=2921757 RepID=UPI0020295170|nr:virulence-associated E family protein [Caballeronia sp. AZ10_KS36]
MQAAEKSSENNGVETGNPESVREALDGIDTANLEAGEGVNDDDSGDFPMKDAGFSDEWYEAQERTRKFKIVNAMKKETTEEALAEIRRKEPDLIKRARAMKVMGGTPAFAWPEVEEKSLGGGLRAIKAISCDLNRAHFFEVVFGKDAAKGRPHIDLFRGRFVDHLGEVVDERYSMVPIIEAMRVAGLTAQPIDGVRKAFKEWAMKVKQNDLIISFEKRVPEWDKKERLEKRLIEIFKPKDTPLNRYFGRYFWLSLYNRITRPGCLAPIVLSLIGAQNAGKSRFSNEICRIGMGDKEATAVQLDLSTNNKNDFLREATGRTIVANIGEMTGFSKGDMNTTKQFITQTSDKMHYKYEGHFDQLRQWVVIMDGNKYEGLQRDETGNRRFFPMFVGQLDDKDGKPQWQEGFQADFTNFESEFWQVMAECRAWMEENGNAAYDKFVREAAQKVFDFNAEEMAAGRGTPRDPIMEVFFAKALSEYEFKWRIESKKNNLPAGVPIYIDDMVEKVSELAKGARVSYDSVRRELEVLSKKHDAIPAKMTGNRPGFLFVPASGKTGDPGVAEIKALLCGGDSGEF